jgi:3-hydroxyisobutyrate dehydrogenase-like beta-hydroxyacid dehydrogenase
LNDPVNGHVVVLHPGEMGAAVGAAVVQTGARVVWSADGRSPATVERAEKAGLIRAESLADALDGAATVLSVCPPAAADATADAVLALGFTGTFVDANAVAPDRARRIGERVTAAGGTAVDGALFGPRTNRPGSRLLLSGAGAPAVAALFGAEAGVTAVVLAGDVGAASALKMAHSTFQKAARPLAALAFALAAEHGVTEQLLAEAEGTGSPLAEPRMVSVAASKAWRWEPELHEVVATLDASDLPSGMVAEAAALLAAWEPMRDDRSAPLEAALAALRLGGVSPPG